MPVPSMRWAFSRRGRGWSGGPQPRKSARCRSPATNSCRNAEQQTHAITIDAPPEAVWRWLVQVGQGWAGFYPAWRSLAALEHHALGEMAVAGVDSVEVDLDTKLVRVIGSALDDAAIRHAIHEAGYAAAHSFRPERG